MDHELLKLLIAVFSGLATAIPLVIKLIEYVQKAVKERNWNRLLNLVMKLMTQAEEKFETGVDKEEWVLAMVKASADTINYDINIDEVKQLIRDLCALSKKVNYIPCEESGSAE